MIPKILHYCWFGGGELPKETDSILQGWVSLHPDWEIKKWDESNSPVDMPYLRKAASANKWANMSNYVRLYALQQYGGVYLDTDMRLLKRLDDLLVNECFLGFEEGEAHGSPIWVNNAIIGAVSNHPFVKQCHDVLLAEFDGMEDANWSAPQMVTKILKESYGLSHYGFQKLNGVTLYPSVFFYPIHYTEAAHLADFERYITPDTYSVHLWARTWLSREHLIANLDSLNLQVQTDRKKWEIVNGRLIDLIQVVGLQNAAGVISSTDEKEQSVSVEVLEKSIEDITLKLNDLASLRIAIEDKSALEFYLSQYKKEVQQLTKNLEEARTDLVAKNEIIAAIQETNHQSQTILNKRLDEYIHQSQLLQQEAGQAQAMLRQTELRNQLLEEKISKQIQLIDRHTEVLLATQKHFQATIASKETLMSEILHINGVLRKECENLAMQRDFSQNAFKKLGIELAKANSEAQKLEERQIQMKQTWEEKERTFYIRAIENEKECETLRTELNIVRQEQYDKEQELESLLRQKIEEKKKAIKWYEDSYVSRSLMGIVKQKLIKRK